MPNFGHRRRNHLDLRYWHLSGRQFEENDQTAFARPVHGPVLENCGVEGDPANRGHSRASRESAMAYRALHITATAGHLSRLLIPSSKPDFPHFRMSRHSRHDGCTQSLMVARGRPSLWLKLREIVRDENDGVAANVPDD